MAYCELRSVTINATSKGANPGQVDFSMTGDGVAGERIACDKKQHMGKEDPHLFVFQLKAEPKKLHFLKDPDAVMQIVSENGVANQGHSNKDLGFDVISVTDDMLVVANLNDKKCDFKFTLNFVDTAGGSARIIPYDPIWGNGNGGTR